MNFFSPENNYLHEEFEQLRRQKSALSLKMDYIDYSNQTGTIKKYSVSLENCSCVDFIMRQKPCKHMYRLAEDLGVFKISKKTSDKNIIATNIYGDSDDYDEKKIVRDKIKDEIRFLTKEAQLELQKFTSRPKRKIYEMYSNGAIDDLIFAGLLNSTELTLRESIENLKVNEIREMCTGEKPKRGLKKNELVDFFLENYPEEAEDYFTVDGMDMVYIELSKDISDNLTAIHRFLCSLVGAPSDRYNYF